MFNVPLNNKLSKLDPDSTEAAKYWLTYLSEWMRWNHVRTIASVIAAALLIVALRRFQLPAK